MVRLEGFQIDDVKGLGDGRYRRVMGLFFRISIFWQGQQLGLDMVYWYCPMWRCWIHLEQIQRIVHNVSIIDDMKIVSIQLGTVAAETSISTIINLPYFIQPKLISSHI